MQIGFIGVGKLGLPVAIAMDYKGHKVMGFDVNPKVKKGVRAIELLTTIEADETGRGSIRQMAEMSMVKFSDKMDEVVKFGDIIFVAVQTPHEEKYEGVTRIPDERKDFDYSYLIQCMKDISKVVDELDKNKIVVIISTVLPGTIRKYIMPILSSKIQLCYNPYFIAMGTTIRDFLFPEFILLGVTNNVAREKVVEFYKSITNSPVYQTTLENAELIKVAYNTFISTKLAFVNTIMEMCDKLPGTNIDEVTNALTMGTRRLLSPMYMTGGMGDGGGCHPRDNIALGWLSNELGLSYNLFDSIMIGREKQTEALADIIIRKYNEYDRQLPICILGKAFKANTNLTAGSPAILLKNILVERGYQVSMYDPYIDGGNFELTKQIYFIGVKHDLFLTYSFPEGSCVIDPHRYIKERSNIEVYQVGVGKTKRAKKMNEEKISIVFPTRKRPVNLQRIYQSINDTVSDPDLVEVCIYIDDDDAVSKEILDYIRLIDKRVKYVQGKRICLSQMWNVAYEKLSTGDIVMHCGDDIIFRTKGWDNMIRNEFSKYPDRIVLVYGNDGIHGSGLATHSFIHRKWIEVSGFFLPPYFVSDFNDTWLDDVAKRINRRVYVADVYTEHAHHVVGKAVIDQNTIERIDRHHAEKPDQIYNSKVVEREEHANKLRKVMVPIYNFDVQKKEWINVPIDDIGYISSATLLSHSDEELKKLIVQFEKNRYSLNNWRNTNNLWRKYSHVDDSNGLKVLDYGCGFGIESLQFAKSGNLVSVADINEQSIAIAEKVVNVSGFKTNGKYLISNEYPFIDTNEKFDIFYSNGVLHHTPKIVEILRRAAELLCDNGRIILMLYSDKAWTNNINAELPFETTKDPAYMNFVRAFDAVGYYADWYNKEKLESLVGDFLKIVEVNYITPNDNYLMVTLVRK